MNIFRVPFLMERLVPGEMTGSLDQAYLEGLKKVPSHFPLGGFGRIGLIVVQTIAFITGSGAYAVLDPHNYGR